MKFLRFGLFGVLGCVGLGVWIGFAGRLYPAADSLSLFRLVLGVICLMAMLIRMRLVWRVMLGVTAGAALVTTLPLLFGGTSGEALTIYSKNIWYRNPELTALAADIIASQAEVVTLQEVSARNENLLNLLAADYPHQHLCRFSGWSGIAVLSVHPITATRCTEQRSMAAAQITDKGREFWVGSIHLPWPYPYANDKAANAAVALISKLDGPVVIAGDFNIFPWADSVQRLQIATQTMPVRPLRPTYYLNGLPLLLDHVHAPGGGQATYRPLLGSDHYGVLARVLLAPGS